jgi:hypothetical protein
MSDTSFAVELKGLDLPDNVRSKIESEMRSAVMGEVAKLDLAKDLQIEPLTAASGERMVGLPPLMGFIIRNLGSGGGILLGERSNGSSGPKTGIPGLPGGITGGANGDSAQALAAGSAAEALEVLYLRPDVRAAVIANSRLFSDLLSRDEKAAQVFNELCGGLQPTERLVPLAIAAILVGSAAAGAAIGWLSRP